MAVYVLDFSLMSTPPNTKQCVRNTHTDARTEREHIITFVVRQLNIYKYEIHSAQRHIFIILIIYYLFMGKCV